MKKIICFFSLLMTVLLLVGCASDGTDWGTVELARRDAETDATIPAQHVAVALSPNAPLGGMEIIFSITGESPSGTVSIYKAEKDYDTTLSGKPVRKESFSPLTEKVLWQFRTLPAGDYLIVFSDLNAATLVRSIVPSDGANGKILHYRNGEIMTDGTCALTLLCIKTDDVPEPNLNTFAYPVPEE
ncbi:MAG: hypothetical protein J6B54_00235 [Clostridia bacterium]|nr:hypothetical protein [Clostridia bacterium]